MGSMPFVPDTFVVDVVLRAALHGLGKGLNAAVPCRQVNSAMCCPQSGAGPPPTAPAPAPAPVAVRPPSELSEGAESVGSRQSSDSSGYHEAGLSDGPDR